MQQKYLERTNQELRLRNYSFKTIKVYLGCLREYFDFKKFNLEKIDEENIKQFLLNKQDKKLFFTNDKSLLKCNKIFLPRSIKNSQKDKFKIRQAK
ncbi:MAG: hypothetical protein Q8R26_02310 [bacterium]|nr:hypothetical protein [bacterium]